MGKRSNEERDLVKEKSYLVKKESALKNETDVNTFLDDINRNFQLDIFPDTQQHMVYTNR